MVGGGGESRDGLNIMRGSHITRILTVLEGDTWIRRRLKLKRRLMKYDINWNKITIKGRKKTFISLCDLVNPKKHVCVTYEGIYQDQD